jgi:hypothetical protein
MLPNSSSGTATERPALRKPFVGRIQPAPIPRATPEHPALVRLRRSSSDAEPQIDHWKLSRLREAVRTNRVSFPSQVPIFAKHDRPDLQRKMVQLYFVLGWNCVAIAGRYGMIRQRVQQILNTWKRRAVQMGYIQNIPVLEEGLGLTSKTSFSC